MSRNRLAFFAALMILPVLLAFGLVYAFPDNSEQNFDTEIQVKLSDLSTPQLVRLNQQIAQELTRRNVR